MYDLENEFYWIVPIGENHNILLMLLSWTSNSLVTPLPIDDWCEEISSTVT